MFYDLDNDGILSVHDIFQGFSLGLGSHACEIKLRFCPFQTWRPVTIRSSRALCYAHLFCLPIILPDKLFPNDFALMCSLLLEKSPNSLDSPDKRRISNGLKSHARHGSRGHHFRNDSKSSVSSLHSGEGRGMTAPALVGQGGLDSSARRILMVSTPQAHVLHAFFKFISLPTAIDCVSRLSLCLCDDRYEKKCLHVVRLHVSTGG